jgi:hypothetical protein
MKLAAKLAMIGIVLGLAMGESYAQTQNVQNVNINLNGVMDGGGKKGAKISNKEILTALVTNGTFSAKAKLVAITPIGGGTTAIVVRDVVNKQNVDTDVSGNFSNTTTQVITGPGSNSETSIQTFTFTSDTLQFAIQGYTTGNTKNLSENSSVNGVATIGGAAAAVRGNINLGPAKAE